MSKPLGVEELRSTLNRLLASVPAPFPIGLSVEENGAISPSQVLPPIAVAFDPNVALARVEGDRELLRKMVGLFGKQAPKLLGEIRAAGTSRDGRALERAAHKLRGSVGNFGAAKAFASAGRLESMAREGDFADTAIVGEELERDVARLQEQLQQLTDEEISCEF